MSEQKKRIGEKDRKTRETEVSVNINIDGEGRSDIDTGVGFLDHMLHLLAKHALFDIRIVARGDLDVDDHHTCEDVGIVLGDAFGEALGDKAGINRFADACIPMQDSLVSVALDICGRPHLVCEVVYPTEKIGEFDTNLVEEFLHAFTAHAGITMHVQCIRGSNSHHIAEAVFKALARCLRIGTAVDSRNPGAIPSTKGAL